MSTLTAALKTERGRHVAKAVFLANDFLISITDHRTIFGFGTILPDLENPVAEV